MKRSILLCAAVLSSCNWYDKTTVQNISGPVPATARVKFFNYGVGSPGVNFYANNQKMTAISSATGKESTNGVTYGIVAAGGYYMAIAPGPYTLKAKAAATSDTIARVATTIADGRSYSFYQSGIYNSTTKTVDAFVVEDPFVPAIEYSVAYVRFVHAISNANPMTLYARPTGDTVTAHWAAVGAELAYKSAGPFTAMSQGLYDLLTRYANTATAVTATGVPFSAGRVYTVTARGNITIADSTDTKRPLLDNTINR